jgi:hypothetical protein
LTTKKESFPALTPLAELRLREPTTDATGTVVVMVD